MGMQTSAFDTLDMTCLAAATVAADVRQRIGLRLARWGLDPLADDLRLIATELVTNACAATPDGRIRIRFTRETGAALLAVWDASDRMPKLRPAAALWLDDPDDLDPCEEDLERNGGRGLHIVRALASECGIEHTTPYGKWIWARALT